MIIKLPKQTILKYITSYGRYWIVIDQDGEYNFIWVAELHEVPEVEKTSFTAPLPIALDEEEQMSVARQVLDTDGRIWDYIQDEANGLAMDYIDYCRFYYPDEWEAELNQALTAMVDIWLEDLNDTDLLPDAPWGYKGNGDGTYSPVILPFFLEWE